MAGRSFFGRIMGRDQSEMQAAVPVSQVNSAPQDNKTYEFNTRLGSSYLNVVNYGTKCTAPYSTEEITRMARDPMQYISELRQWAKWAYYSNGTVTTAIDRSILISCQSQKLQRKSISCKRATIWMQRCFLYKYTNPQYVRRKDEML